MVKVPLKSVVSVGMNMYSSKCMLMETASQCFLYVTHLPDEPIDNFREHCK